MKHKKNVILRYISSDQILKIRPLDGRQLICQATDVFKYIPVDFIRWGINRPDIATLETLARVYKLSVDGKSADIFQALPGTWNQKYLSQHQVIDVCRNLPESFYLKNEPLCFLIKQNGNEAVSEEYPEKNLIMVSVDFDGALFLNLARLHHSYNLGVISCIVPKISL